MSSVWNLHYRRWVIEDGQPDRHVGETFRWFAVEFWSDRLVRASEDTITAVPIDDYLYRVVAHVTYVDDRSCVVDFGLKAASTRDRLPKDCRAGDFVSGTIGLELPLCIDVLPEVIDTLGKQWRVDRITADLTPYISGPDNPRYFFCDSSRVKVSEVNDTDEVQAPDYILRCAEIKDSE